MSDVQRFLSALRDTHPDMVDVFTKGRCYSLFELMRTVWPQARAHYSAIECHVYVDIDGSIFDIRGRHFKPPADLDLLDHRRGDKPHRWGKRDARRIE